MEWIMRMIFKVIFLFFTALLLSCSQDSKQGQADMQVEKNLYWGDLHNHSAVGYARGSLERAYEVAQSHLDVFCFTGHSQWYDMPIMPQNKHMKWVNGFKVMEENWEKVVNLANSTYEPGKFVPFIGYEWHSSAHGDMHIIFPGSEAELKVIHDIKKFQQYAEEQNAILIPHHPAYKQDWRGQNWTSLNTDLSPVVEIFSEHGNAESDRSPYRYIRHSMGGRYTVNTLQYLWEQGVQVGVTAGTDDHLGYPGAYGEGLTGFYAEELTRESILEAIKARRTYGVSHDRIELAVKLNDHWMGESIPYTSLRKIAVQVKGKDVIDRVEVLRNNHVIYRDHPVDNQAGSDKWNKPVLARIEFGWGPWGDLDMARVCDWDFEIKIDNGKILEATPAFQSGPYAENRRNRMTLKDDQTCVVESYTSRKQAYEERPTNAIILELEGNPETKITLNLTEPNKQSITKTLAELEESSDVFFTGPFTAESILMHRVVFSDNYNTEFTFTDENKIDETQWYYVRVTQTNGSLAWSSPIWVNAE